MTGILTRTKSVKRLRASQQWFSAFSIRHLQMLLGCPIIVQAHRHHELEEGRNLARSLATFKNKQNNNS